MLFGDESQFCISQCDDAGHLKEIFNDEFLKEKKSNSPSHLCIRVTWHLKEHIR